MADSCGPWHVKTNDNKRAAVKTAAFSPFLTPRGSKTGGYGGLYRTITDDPDNISLRDIPGYI